MGDSFLMQRYAFWSCLHLIFRTTIITRTILTVVFPFLLDHAPNPSSNRKFSPRKWEHLCIWYPRTTQCWTHYHRTPVIWPRLSSLLSILGLLGLALSFNGRCPGSQNRSPREHKELIDIPSFAMPTKIAHQWTKAIWTLPKVFASPWLCFPNHTVNGQCYVSLSKSFRHFCVHPILNAEHILLHILLPNS